MLNHFNSNYLSIKTLSQVEHPPPQKTRLNGSSSALSYMFRQRLAAKQEVRRMRLGATRKSMDENELSSEELSEEQTNQALVNRDFKTAIIEETNEELSDTN